MTDNYFTRMGSETAVRQLVDRFYDLMDELEAARDIRQLHAPDTSEARDKLFMFLCGWLGGPPLYIEKYGHPKLRQRHLPFRIGEKERDQWMLCMTQSMADIGLDDALRNELTAAFFRTADFMRNTG
ncbi:MAG TPA: group II truncated hemoglobin [Gammaproteobacteria bacterium]|nr:group II truncated hemoglobin [Gammaproteobacteria bacterium]